MKTFGLPRSFLIFALTVPLAIFMGYLLASPFEFRTYAFVLLVLFVISIPLWVKYHHGVMICVWNAAIILPLPGQPALWVVLACLSLFFSVLQRTMDKRYHFINVPMVTIPILFLCAVVFFTVLKTGGIGGRAV